MELSLEEKKAIENVKDMFEDISLEELIKNKDINVTIYSSGILDILRVIGIVEKQQKEIEELEKKCNNKYYHTIKCRELEKEINNGWKDKINKLKEEVETEQISNPYDFIYLLNEILDEK